MPQQVDGAAEVLLQLNHRQLRVGVVVYVVVDTGHGLHVLQDGAYVVTYDDDGAIAVDIVEHLVHLFLELPVNVGVGFIQNQHFWSCNDGASQQHTLQLATTQGANGTPAQFGELHSVERFVHHVVVLGREW